MSINQTDEKVTTIAQVATQHENDIGNLITDVSANSNNITSLTSKVSTNTSSISTANTSISDLKSRVSSLESGSGSYDLSDMVIKRSFSAGDINGLVCSSYFNKQISLSGYSIVDITNIFLKTSESADPDKNNTQDTVHLALSGYNGIAFDNSTWCLTMINPTSNTIYVGYISFDVIYVKNSF